MEGKISPKIICWVELIDPWSGRVVERIPMDVEYLKQKQNLKNKDRDRR
jgi:hypothetical protein